MGSQDGGPDIPAGGLGGVSLSSYFTQDKLFLGGTGGSGYVTTSNPSDATDGGGIVILFVDTLVGNGNSILANGTTPVAVNPVGAPDGGGGGGGSVLLNVLALPDSLTVTANGGDGQNLNTNNYHGPGGGGGGVLLYSLPSLPAAVTFGADGGAPGVHSDGYDNGADSGAVGGTFGLYVPIENVNYRANIDNDPIAPVCDIDDDGDGLTDIQEIYTYDHDGDDTLDWADSDFCLDVFDGVSGWSCAVSGLPNPTADMDDDGYANFIDSDFPYCGSFILGIDAICSNFDPDGDGIPSHLDLDSDNDGIPDIIEAGGSDTNGDGQADVTLDTDGLYDIFDNDDTDGPQGSSPCSVQPGCLDLNSYSILPTYDSDNDTIPDYLDSDSDNDGIPDVVEAGGVDVNGDGRLDNFGDSDGDGLSDLIDALICEDSVDIVTSNNIAYGTYLGGSSTGIVNGGNASGAPNTTFAQVYDATDRLVLDLGSVYPIGSTYILRWRRKATYGSGPTADMVVRESSDNSTYTTNSVTPQDNTQVFKSTVMTTQVATRYLQVYPLTGSNDDIDFDAVTIGDSTISYNVYEVCISNTPIFTTGSDTDGDALPNSLTFGDADGDGIFDYRDLDSDNDGIPDVVEAGGTDADGDADYVDLDSDDDTYPDEVEGHDMNGDGLPDATSPANTGVSGGATDVDVDGLIDGWDNNTASTDATNSSLTPSSHPDVHNPGGDRDWRDNKDTDEDGVSDHLDLDDDNDGVPDGDGISNVFDPDNGGTYLTPVDTDGDGTPDYMDTDTDDDGESDLIEGWDTDGDGVANTSPANSDTDGDGLDDNFDNVATINETTNPSNNAQDALDFPNTDDGTSERDWREAPCADGSVVMAPLNGTSSLTNFCQMDADWTYYYNPADPTELLFAVEHTPAGGNTNAFALTVSLTASSNPQTEAGVYSAEDIPNEDATFVMGRYYNISVTSGTLNGNVNIRFYYDQADADTMLAVAQRWNATNAGGTNFVTGLRWFAMNSGTFDPGTTDLTDEGIANSTEWFPTATGTEDGFNFAQFSASSFTGGGLAYSVGTNSVILPVELLDFDAHAISQNEVNVTWSTASEINNDHFMVERSSDMSHWDDIRKVAGAGNSAITLYYEYLDQAPLMGRSFYRLRQVDYNGTTSHSEAREVLINDVRVIDGLFEVYPNPSFGSVFIRVNSAGVQMLKVRNAIGQEVRSLQSSGNEIVEVSGLAPGVYFLTARGSEPISLKFVILD